MTNSLAYPHGFVIVIECGAIYRWVGMGEDLAHAERLAASDIAKHTDLQIWDMCSVPLRDTEHAAVINSGEPIVTLLRPSDA